MAGAFALDEMKTVNVKHLDINGNWIEMMEINTVAINKWQRWSPRQFVRNREKRTLYVYIYT